MEKYNFIVCRGSLESILPRFIYNSKFLNSNLKNYVLTRSYILRGYILKIFHTLEIYQIEVYCGLLQSEFVFDILCSANTHYYLQ